MTTKKHPESASQKARRASGKKRQRAEDERKASRYARLTPLERKLKTTQMDRLTLDEFAALIDEERNAGTGHLP